MYGLQNHLATFFSHQNESQGGILSPRIAEYEAKIMEHHRNIVWGNRIKIDMIQKVMMRVCQE